MTKMATALTHLQVSKLKGPKLKPVARTTSEQVGTDGHTDTLTAMDDLEDWRSSLDGSDAESLLTAERTVASVGGGAGDATWNDSSDVMPYKNRSGRAS